MDYSMLCDTELDSPTKPISDDVAGTELIDMDERQKEMMHKMLDAEGMKIPSRTEGDEKPPLTPKVHKEYKSVFLMSKVVRRFKKLNVQAFQESMATF